LGVVVVTRCYVVAVVVVVSAGVYVDCCYVVVSVVTVAVTTLFVIWLPLPLPLVPITVALFRCVAVITLPLPVYVTLEFGYVTLRLRSPATFVRWVVDFVPRCLTVVRSDVRCGCYAGALPLLWRSLTTLLPVGAVVRSRCSVTFTFVCSLRSLRCSHLPVLVVYVVTLRSPLRSV